MSKGARTAGQAYIHYRGGTFFLMQIEVGSILEGKVSGITGFGAFVDLPDGKTGMVHISEVSNTFVENVSDFLTVGQTVKVKVLAVNENGKISLSIKRLQDNGSQRGGEHRDRGRGDNRRGGRNNNRNGQNTGNNKQRDRGAQQRPRQPQHRSVKSAGSPGDFVWQKSTGPESFEDMMSKFKQQSDEKISTLKKGSDGYAPRRPRRKG